MCSFIILNTILENIEFINFFLKFRGPDLTNKVILNGIMFIHNLLHLTGKLTPQPFVDSENQIVALFNGEIYNYKTFGVEYESDGCCLIDAYKKFGPDFVKRLDGEFAIVLFDFEKDLLIISTDVFATKPVWYNFQDKKLGISTYESGLIRAGFENSIKVPPNTTLVFNISTLELINTMRVYKFQLQQWKTSYDDWCVAFIEAVKKRTDSNNYPIFVCLSSGYDSGSICCALNTIQKEYNTYTIISDENKDLLREREVINKENSLQNSHIIDFTRTEFQELENYVKTNAETFLYRHTTMSKFAVVTDDQASVGMAKICGMARSKNQRIYLSGTGADEIHSDYGSGGSRIFSHSCFGGVWPEDLGTILSNDPAVPVVWKSFYDGTQRDYLAKEEIISGLYGIEGRYPFLDKYVVQEFLSLSPSLKNGKYKAPLDYFMSKYKYPFESGVKRGFNAAANLK